MGEYNGISFSDKDFIEMVNMYSNDESIQFFERDATSNETSAGSVHTLLTNIVNQLAQPINAEAEAVSKWLIYKQAGPHRHQKFFGYFRRMSKLLQQYNDLKLAKKLSGVLKRGESSGNFSHRIAIPAIRYVGCAFCKRVYLLDKIRTALVSCANGVFGLLGLEHWTNLALVIVSICAQVHSEITVQLSAMENVYENGSSIFVGLDNRFPLSLNDLSVTQEIKRTIELLDDRRKVDLAAASRLLKYSEKKILLAQTENEIRRKRIEVLTEIFGDDLSSYQTVETVSIPRQISTADLGIPMSRSDFISSKSIDDCCEADDEKVDKLTSPLLFGTKSLQTKDYFRADNNDPANRRGSKCSGKTTTFAMSTLSLLRKKEKKAPGKSRAISKSKN